MEDVSKPKKQERYTVKCKKNGEIIYKCQGTKIPEAINRLGELEDKLEDGRLWEAKYLEPRPHPIECCERWAEMYFEVKAKLDGYEDVIKNGGALLTPEENQCWEKSVNELIEKAIKNYKQKIKEKYGIEVPDDDGQLTDQGGKQ